MNSSIQTFGSTEPLDILCIAPHPDDAEIGCGGSLARAKSEGQRTGILELTLGEMGSLGTPEIRLQETRDAAEILGLGFRGNMRWQDGGIQDSEIHRLELAQVIRSLKPKTLLVPHETDRHPDHVAAARVATSAIHFAGLRKAKLTGEPHKVTKVLYYQGNAPIEANVLVDVTEFMNVWEAAIMAHASQFTGEAVSETVSPEILERRKARMMYWGTFIGARYAESYQSRLPLKFGL
jgi:N-acetylglucosamine malate deacetylase 1